MRVVVFRLLQVVFAIALLAIAFWPDFGLFYVARDNLAAYPYVVAVGTAIWVLLLALNLPLSRRHFQWVGALCFVALMATGLVFLSSKGWFEGNQDQLIITAIICGGILLGWFTVASHIWRSYRGVYGVDDSDTGPDE